ncbi:peptidoglycan DD-metalloendopeptidase family protein [Gorillibacterium sp. sgz5001074]|uniref:peptidoglycan DD-metalloendopeptidase family protein n=1 Tax=Gorillibacterium sp. sgz5001074 TaxID=3446695 RepID=UPI003F665296
MEVKANVQKRRQDRIRELQARKSAHIEGVPPSSVRREGPGDGKSTYGRPEDGLGPLWLKGPLPPEPDHGGDPEVAWKNREKELLRWYADGDAPPGGASPGEAPDPGAPGSGRWTGPDETRTGGGRAGGRGPAGRMFMLKTGVAAVLFLGALAVTHLDTPWSAKVKGYLVSALSEDMDFGAVADWYARTFDGAPSFLPAFGDKSNATKVHAPVTAKRFNTPPVKGKVKEGYTEAKQGIWLSTRKDAHVAAVDDGRIEFSGETPETGPTLVIQHADGYRVTYGGLQPTKWEAGDWVKAGDVIGTAREQEGQGAVYLAVMKDQRYVDPADVVTFD